MVAVENGSMEPEIYRGDLIVTVDEHRFSRNSVTGIVTYQIGEQESYHTFDSYGDAIIYQPDGDVPQIPIIHELSSG